MLRFRPEIAQYIPRPKWQTADFWVENLKDGLAWLLFLGGAVGFIVIANAIGEWLRS